MEFYYSLFLLIVEDSRIMPKKLAEELGHTGRGKSPSTIVHHLQSMYNREISMEPRTALKAFESTQITTYLCKRRVSKGLYSMFRKIDKDPNVTYAMCLSSTDFFLMSRDNDLQIENFGLILRRKSKLFTPIYTIPTGWNRSMEEAMQQFLKFPFVREEIPRTIYKGLNWDDLDWKIFDFMRRSVRHKFTVVARGTGSTSKTVKDRFYKKILPNCVTAHYFFPKGYSYYLKTFLEIRSEYEVSITKALKRLPCTTYVYPLEKSVLVILFHESTEKVLEILEKTEERAIIDSYLLYSPLVHSK